MLRIVDIIISDISGGEYMTTDSKQLNDIDILIMFYFGRMEDLKQEEIDKILAENFDGYYFR